MQRLGEYLVEKGWLRQEALDHALALQESSGERLGVILLALSMVRREQLYIALSDLWGFPYVRLNVINLSLTVFFDTASGIRGLGLFSCLSGTCVLCARPLPHRPYAAITAMRGPVAKFPRKA